LTGRVLETEKARRAKSSISVISVPSVAQPSSRLRVEVVEGAEAGAEVAVVAGVEVIE
jgi:hypothetical protein